MVKLASCLAALPSTCSALHLKLQLAFCVENFQCQASSATPESLARLPSFSGCPGECHVSPEALPLQKSCSYSHQREQPVVAQACFCSLGGTHWSLLVWGRWRAVDLRLASYASDRVHKHLNLVHSNHTNATSSLRQNFSLQRCISSCRERKKLPSPAQKGTEKQYHLPLSPFPLKSHSWNQWDWNEESKTKSQRTNGVRKGKKVCEEKANYRLSTDSSFRWGLVIFLTLCFVTVTWLFSAHEVSPLPESGPYP